MNELKVNRSYTLSVKSASREVEGLFSIFGSKDLVNDVTLPGSMAASLAKRKPIFLWMHDATQVPVAVVTEAYEIVGRDALPKSVLREYPDSSGAGYVKRRYIPSPRGDELLAAHVAGSPLQMSFAYSVERYEIKGGIRYLQQVTITDISDVTYGAHPGTVNNLQLAKGFKYAGGTAVLPGMRLPGGHAVNHLEALEEEAGLLYMGALTARQAKHIGPDEAGMLVLGIMTPQEYMRGRSSRR